MTDAVYLLNFNFLGGPPPPAPFRSCGRSLRSSDQTLGCETGVAFLIIDEFGIEDEPALQLIDVSNPRIPTIIDTRNTRLSIQRGLSVSDDIAYVASVSRLGIIDVGNPARPWLRGTLNTTDRFYDVAVSGGLAYVVGRGGLWVIDVSSCQPSARWFLRGDATDDGHVDLTDAVFILNWLFVDAPASGCSAAANANRDPEVDLSDSVYLLIHLFLGGPIPPQPFPKCGPAVWAYDREFGCEMNASNCP